jgi:hypothetical protein
MCARGEGTVPNGILRGFGAIGRVSEHLILFRIRNFHIRKTRKLADNSGVRLTHFDEANSDFLRLVALRIGNNFLGQYEPKVAPWRRVTPLTTFTCWIYSGSRSFA